MNEITDSVVQIIAGTIEKLLLEQREGIAFSYKKIPDGIKVAIGVNLDPTSQGVEVNYSIAYPLEPAPEPALKHTVKKKQIINENQMDILDSLKPDSSVTLDAR